MSSGMEAKGSGGSRARRKLLTAEEAELFELAQAAGTGLDPEVFKILLDLLRMNVAPVAIYQVLRAMCAAGQRVSGPEANATEPPRGRPRTISATSGNQTLSDQSSREGSIQRVPRQPSASRLQKAGCPGKSA
ncbi:mitotic-spindle organizing protein 2B isoform X3 [Anolis carolinensis]|uniref:mitotic-spindle organizing protein 2B isoform X3 n=1 Tax=Anolis carolinensis TaxID=28377 RepID=UPI000203B303|nr:PREDICTED: mitotic-spindle organizing protein 2B isoform X3 [Anolis carolinensis]|eukprot:XP_003229087.1 PREDICTED: mitotic-spindle organizing protein 2B isoform X3 [Anolis carolinensis]